MSVPHDDAASDVADPEVEVGLEGVLALLTSACDRLHVDTGGRRQVALETRLNVRRHVGLVRKDDARRGDSGT